MARRPTSLVHAVDENPPALFTFFSALQHVSVNTVWLAYPLLIVRESGMAAGTAVSFLSICLVVLGLGTLVQSIHKGPVGSGYLAPSGFTGIYLGPSLVAVKAGGLPLLFGMTMVAGLVEAVLSRLLQRLRPYLPPEVAGLVVFFIGLVVGAVGVRYMLGVGADTPPSDAHYLLGAASLVLMVVLNVWAKGAPKLFCVLIGVAFGYVAAVLLGVLPASDLAAAAAHPFFAVPSFAHVSWAFDASVILPFAIAGLAAALSTTASVTVIQKMHDADWKRPDMAQIKRGVLADGVSTMVAGGLGTFGQIPSTSNVGLVAATGVASRRIAWVTGAILVVMGFLPPVAHLFSVMPRAVMGAALAFSAAFILVGGMQIITSRMIDARRTFVISGSIIACLTPLLFPSFGADAPPAVRALIGSPLAFGTLTALALNLVFRIGVHRTMRFDVPFDENDPRKIEDRMRDLGAAWGARPEVIQRAAFAIQQFVDATAGTHWRSGPLAVTTTFDEFNLDVRLAYTGAALELPDTRPSNEEILASEAGARRLAGYLLRRNADRVTASTAEGRAVLNFRFDH
jgi:NCS2 family nucleobase:cation symporter-2